MFRIFLKTELPCLVVSQFNPDNVIRGAQVWISVNIGESLMRQCVAEELYNSIGLDEGTEVGSIFDFRFSHDNLSKELSAFDLLLMKLLYRHELKVGSTRTQTIESVSNIVKNECMQMWSE